jgi:hypothetical protein
LFLDGSITRAGVTDDDDGPLIGDPWRFGSEDTYENKYHRSVSMRLMQIKVAAVPTRI